MKRFLNKYDELWHLLASIGLDNSVEEKERKYIQVTNILTAATIIATSAYALISFVQGHYPLASILFVEAVCILSVFWCNLRRHYRISRIAYIFVVNSFILSDACFIGHESHVNDFFHLSFVLPFLLFNIRDYKVITIGMITTIIFFETYQVVYHYFTPYNLDLASQVRIYNIDTWLKFICAGGALYILSYYNFLREKELTKSNQTMQKQGQELKRSNEDLERFAYIISHDLKQPLRNVSSLMEILTKHHVDSLPNEIIEFIKLSHRSAQRMSCQIDDLLAYSKIGSDLPAARQVDLNAMVHTIQMEMSEKIQKKNARIIIERPLPEMQQVHSSMIYHVFQNLIANGIKFNLSAAPEVRIDYTVQTDKYVFEVHDNGIGIDKTYQGVVFQMFKRLHADCEFEGTGIGLAVCKKTVNFYGGDIWIESNKNAGSSFYFTFPKHEPVQILHSPTFVTYHTPHLACA